MRQRIPVRNFLRYSVLFDTGRGRCKKPASVQRTLGVRRTSTENNYEASPTYQEITEPRRDTPSGRNTYELETATSESRYTHLQPSAPPPICSIPYKLAPSSSSSSAAAAVVNDPTYNNTTTTLIDNTLYGVQQQIPVTSSNVADNDITLIDNDLYG